ncbi:hypothetical protein SAMD00019534_085020 [Acytostelium subglobosum LB1]|uniref:hypothetical protein n=1 Tax=Acytostelium subglobosum LB1 TaxID=1410327 RepID=UPI000644C1E8|nr:hypothetical protein SAMD00019534_085020 [Acytostelium subglobosum LB1]GAM25327.1 hypothetical protein SAMD00019534_085020 [Acytostelium subglobosum LB1]|eukprot:XP_012751847.1 hypothetical protein SAMD00019534_085020 [Acytostelium subglobosum LB1]
MTQLGQVLDPVSGNVTKPRSFTVGSKEASHLSLLALGLNGITDEGYDPLDLFHWPVPLTPEEKVKINTGDQRLDNVLVILYRKMKSLEDFNAKQPGYGGFIPWIGITDTGLDNKDKTNAKTVSLDDGQMAWGIYPVAHVLQKPQYKDHHELGLRYRKYFDLMADNAATVFLNKTGNYFAMASIVGQSNLPVKDNTYKSDGPDASRAPLDGEPFAIFAYLFA